MAFSGKIDVLTCGSNTVRFLSQIAFARMCFDALGGVYRDARFVACLGEYEKPELPPGWAPYFENIEVVWSNPDKLPNPSFNLQHEKRFEVMREDADIAIICDADVCLMRPFDDILTKLTRDGMLGGVVAHYHFRQGENRIDPVADWQKVARAVLGHEIALPNRYMLGLSPDDPLVNDLSELPPAPHYFNYGVLMGPPAQLRRMYDRERALRPAIAAEVGEHFAAQVGVALALAGDDVPVRNLPVRFNYANRPETETLYPEEMKRIVFFHYMYEENFRRRLILAHPRPFKEFLHSDLTGADALLRRHIKRICGGRYPFPGTMRR